jgi:tellurite methyltransferase
VVSHGDDPVYLVKTDREKWDSRYHERSGPFPEPDPFLVDHAHLLRSGHAVDLACGRGANAIFLAGHGYAVDAVDISFRGLSVLLPEALRRGLDVRCIVADLDYHPLPRDFYDLVVVFYFFSESLMGTIRECLKLGGLVIYATYNWRHALIHPHFNPAYLVPPDGLAQYFSGFTSLIHETTAGERRNISRLIAEKVRHGDT